MYGGVVQGKFTKTTSLNIKKQLKIILRALLLKAIFNKATNYYAAILPYEKQL